MTLIMVPAFIALLIKLPLIMVAGSSSRVQPKWFYFVLIFCLQNLSEIAVLVNFSEGTYSDFVIRNFYVCSIAVLAFCLIYVVDSSCSVLFRSLVYCTIGTAVILSSLIVLSNSVVAGSLPLSYSVTALQGEHYYLFRVFGLSVCAMILSVLIWRYVRSSNQEVRLRAMWTLIALAPPLLITISVIVLMASGYKVNALLFTPIGSTLFLIITLKSATSLEKINDSRRLQPCSKEKAAATELLAIQSGYLFGKMSHPEAMEKIERALLYYKAKECQGNASKIARSIGIPRSTLYDKASRLKINLKKTD